METEQHVETHPEVTGPENKPTLVEHIKGKFSAVKEKIVGHHDHHSPPANTAEGKAHDVHDLENGHENEHASSPRGGVVSNPKGGVVSHPKAEDIHIPEGGLIMTAALEEPESPEEHHGFREKIKNVFNFPVPDTTVTPEKDFEETVPPNLKI